MEKNNKNKILVVDDNIDAANLLGKLLERFGYVASTAYSGLEALKKIDKINFNAAFLDIAMPEMDGYELARKIRSKRSEDILLVALTGHGQNKDKEEAKKAGFDYHVTKPVSIQELKELLEQNI